MSTQVLQLNADSLKHSSQFMDSLKLILPDSLLTYQSTVKTNPLFESFLGIPFMIWQFIIFPSLVIGITLLVNTWNDRRKIFNRLKILKEYILVWMEDIPFQLTKQMDAIEKFVKNISDVNNRDNSFLFNSIYSEFILEIEKDDVFKILVFKSGGDKRENTINLTKFLISMKFIDDNNINLRKNYEDYIEETELKKKLYKEKITAVLKLKTEILIHKDGNQDEFPIHVEEIYQKFLKSSSEEKNKNKKVSLLVDDFVIPLMNYSFKYYKEHPKYKAAQEFYVECTDVIILYNDIVKAIENTIENYKMIHSQMNLVHKDVIMLMGKMKENKLLF